MGFADFFRKKSSSNVAKDIIHVLSKYVEIDLDGLDIKIEQTESEGSNGMVPALFANIPIKDMKQTKK